MCRSNTIEKNVVKIFLDREQHQKFDDVGGNQTNVKNFAGKTVELGYHY